MRVALIAHTRKENPLGRLYANWQALHEYGVDVRVLLPPGDLIWPPVALDRDFQAAICDSPDQIAKWASVLVAHKPFIRSLDIALALGRSHHKQVVLDVDDPDFENQFGTNVGSVAARVARDLKSPRRLWRDARLIRLRNSLHRVDGITVSNPALVGLYGRQAEIIPHARRERLAGEPHVRDEELRVGFVGTPRAHKGIETLRQAVRTVQGATLTVTADAPEDPRSNEQWIGPTTLEEGLRIVDRSDVICLPSTDSEMGRGQLPAKLMDAMISGRAIVATDLPPLRWALGGTGYLVSEPSVRELGRALMLLKDPAVRQSMGNRARARSLAEFVAPKVGEKLAAYLGSLS